MQIFFYNSDDFDSLNTAIKERRIIAAVAVFFQVRILFRTFQHTKVDLAHMILKFVRITMRMKNDYLLLMLSIIALFFTTFIRTYPCSFVAVATNAVQDWLI